MHFCLKIVLFFSLFMLTSSFLGKSDNETFHSKIDKINFTTGDNTWADSVLATLSLEQKIAQLMMLAVYSNKDENYNRQMVEVISKYQLGGVIFMQGGPVRQALLTNRLQSSVKVPLLVAIDAEWGLSMRLDSTVTYPRAMMLGAIDNEKYLYDFGVEMARQCKRMGIQINFAPVLDINCEPKNPVINSRSFGEDKENVTLKSLAYTCGLQDNHVLAVGKHFPGHGDTQTDSHFALPLVNHDKDKLNQLDLYPFKTLIKHGIGGIMVAHLSVPALEPNTATPSSLSTSVIDSLLLKEFDFKGLVFTDALNMKGVADAFKPGEIELKALLAGNDVLLFPQDVELAIHRIAKAVAEGLITEDAINQHCLKILGAKQWAGLPNIQPVDTTHLISDLHTPQAMDLNRQLTEKSLTLIQKSKKGIVPIEVLQDKRIFSICFGGKSNQVFQNYLNLYTQVDTLNITENVDSIQKQEIIRSINRYDLLIISILGTNEIPKQNFGVKLNHLEIIDQLAGRKTSILVHLGNPYALAGLQNTEKFDAVIVGYSDTRLQQQLSAQVIFGGVWADGKLPVSVNNYLKTGMGSPSKKKTSLRLKYTTPSELGLNSHDFDSVDMIIKKSMDEKVMPGCQVLFAVDGKVIYHKAFGYHTYSKQRPVQLNDIYDIASVTKIAATTNALMVLYDEKNINLKHALSDYLPYLKNTDKENLKINEILTHQAGFHSWIAYYKNTLDEKGKFRKDLYASDSSAQFNARINQKLFLRSDYYDSIFKTIADTPVYEEKKYRYSDIGFILFSRIIHEKTGQPLDEFCLEKFYEPLGMNNTRFKPAFYFDINRIPPTENDTYFRNTIVQGYVHDMGAAMLGGVSGHAGLFSDANDLAKLGQMWLNKGTYANHLYIKKKTIETFTSAPFKESGNRRALGFDKPALKPDEPGPACILASQSSFGHMGFTGAYLWVDPENKSIMVFLTNRSFPDAENKKLAEQNIRTRIQNAFYSALKK